MPANSFDHFAKRATVQYHCYSHNGNQSRREKLKLAGRSQRGPLGQVGGEMKHRRFWSSVVASVLLTLSAGPAAYAQTGNFPNKTVTIISDAAAGAAPDVAARFVAEGLSKIWGQQVIVLNRPGAN